MKLNKLNFSLSLETLDGPLHELNELKEYFNIIQKNKNFSSQIIGLSELKNWNFNKEKNFAHETNKFFTIKKIQYDSYESGILHQEGEGILAVFVTLIDNIPHFLIQFKEEPGNINKSQLSPTIQATKSNYSKVHGGKAPLYWNEFLQIREASTLINLKQPEQGYRYWRKFNQNMILLTDYFEEQKGFKWMTLGQIFSFIEIDNSINSCLRSVLSLMFYEDINENKPNKLYEGVENLHTEQYKNFGILENDIQSFYSTDKDALLFETPLDSFSIKGVEVRLEDREVSSWNQPIIVEKGKLFYVLVRIKVENNFYHVWKIYNEPGYSFGYAFGPTEIIKNNELEIKDILNIKINEYSKYGQVCNSQIINMSEEGGRFWQTVVSNLIITLESDEIPKTQFPYIVLDEISSYKLIMKSLMSMEGRSIFFMSKGNSI